MESLPVTSEAVRLANEAVAATPSVKTLAGLVGEENFHGDEHGEFEVRAVDKYGAPDMRKARALREAFGERTKIEKKLTACTPKPPAPEPRVARGTIFCGPPRGGWPVFGADGRVVE